MPNTVEVNRYLKEAEEILKEKLRGSPVLTVISSTLPMPQRKEKTAGAVLVQVNDGRQHVPQNKVVFFTAAPLWTNEVFFHLQSKILSKDAWIPYANNEHITELKKYAKILCACF